MPNLFTPVHLAEGYLIDDYYRYYLKFNKVRKTDLINLNPSLRITRAQDMNYLYYRLETIDKIPLSIIRLEQDILLGKKYYKVDKSHSFQRQNGYGTILYEYALCYCRYPIISDKNQTKPGSCDLWKKLQSRQSTSAYAVQVFNTKTEHIALYDTRNYKDHDIWGLSQKIIDTYSLQNIIDFISNDTDFTDDEYEIEDDIFESFENNFSGINPEIKEFVSNAKNNISDREHIRLIGHLKK